MDGALLVGHFHDINPMRFERTDLTTVGCKELTLDGFYLIEVDGWLLDGCPFA